MNPLFDRLYSWVRSELEWDHSTKLEKDTWTDPDLQAAEEELEEFLKGSGTSKSSQRKSEENYNYNGSAGPFDRNALALAQAYMELGLAPGATWEDVKTAQKQLLRTHHPDRHGGSRESVDMATKKTQRINEAFQTIKKALGK